jgi:hypothetical protein
MAPFWEVPERKCFSKNHQVTSVVFHTKTQIGRYIKENSLKKQARTNYKTAIFSQRLSGLIWL